MTDEQTNLETYADAIRRRLAKHDPDYQGIASELLGAQRMALALGDEQAAALVRDLHGEVLDAWGQAIEGDDDRPDAAVQAAIAEHGAAAVHRAAQDTLEGGAGLRGLGVEPTTAGDAWRALSAAYDAMDEEQRRRVDAHADAALEVQPGGYPVVAVGAENLEELEELPPAMTLGQAKATAAARGHQVVDQGCESTDAWRGATAHVVTVEEGAR